jgi:16S rRNA (adenine1518-N6/adenine1519-N6)-dimethyltransferase
MSEVLTMRAKKRYGQHFLEPQWADKLVAAIEPRPSDRFLEIGPGPGALTVRLAPRVAHVTAVEIDPALVAALRPRLPGNVTLVETDFLEFDPTSLGPGPLRVAGNLPYNVSSPILFRLLEWAASSIPRETGAASFPAKEAAPFLADATSLADATLMVQREVAERIEAKPGGRDYGVLAILVQLHADVKRLLSLPPGAFRPPPKVQSAVLSVRFRPPRVAIRDELVFAAMVRSMFTRRRKMLGNALSPFAENRGADAAAVLDAAGIDHRRRPETLQLEELARLADLF